MVVASTEMGSTTGERIIPYLMESLPQTMKEVLGEKTEGDGLYLVS